MKRLALMLLALVLCLSLCLTGCNGDGDSTTGSDSPAANNGGSNGNKEPVKPINKEEAVEVFNSFDLGAVFEDTDLTAEDLLETVNSLTFGAEGTAKLGDMTADASIAMKNGLIYFSITDMPGYYAYIGNNSVTLFAQGEDGAWAPFDPSAPMGPEDDGDFTGGTESDINNKDEFSPDFDEDKFSTDFDYGDDGDFGTVGDIGDLNASLRPMSDFTTAASETPAILDLGQYSAMIGMLKETASKIVVPDVTPADLTQEGDMLVLSNAYIVKLLRANAAILMGAEPGASIPEADIDEAMKDVEPSLKAVGLKLAFALKSGSISKLSISVKFDDSEMGKNFREDSNLSAMSITAELTNSGNTLKKLAFELAHDFSEYEKGYTPKSSLELTATLNDKFETVGTKIDATLYSTNGYSRGETSSSSSGNVGTRKIVSEVNVEKMTLKLSTDLSKLSVKDAEVASITFNLKPEKAFKTTAVYNKADGIDADPVSKETVAITPEGTVVEASAKIKSKGDDNFTIAASLTTDGETGSIAVTAYTKTAPNFPKQIPAEIDAFIKGE